MLRRNIKKIVTILSLTAACLFANAINVQAKEIGDVPSYLYNRFYDEWYDVPTIDNMYDLAAYIREKALDHYEGLLMINYIGEDEDKIHTTNKKKTGIISSGVVESYLYALDDPKNLNDGPIFTESLDIIITKEYGYTNPDEVNEEYPRYLVWGIELHDYDDTKEQEEAANKILKKEAKKLNIIDNPKLSDYEKIMLIVNWVIKNCNYYREETSVYKGLTGDKEFNCQGYAKTYKKLCELADIPNILVTGSLDEEGHVWNYIKVDGKWYYSDLSGIIYYNEYVFMTKKELRSFGYTIKDMWNTSTAAYPEYMNPDGIISAVDAANVSFQANDIYYKIIKIKKKNFKNPKKENSLKYSIPATTKVKWTVSNKNAIEFVTYFAEGDGLICPFIDITKVKKAGTYVITCSLSTGEKYSFKVICK